MEINPNHKIGPPARARNVEGAVHPPKPEAPQNEFSHAAALKMELDRAPEVRPEVVARAMKAVSNVQYPPTETIRQLSSLLAIHMMEESKDG